MYIMGICYDFPFQVLLTDNRKLILSSFLLNKKIIIIKKDYILKFGMKSGHRLSKSNKIIKTYLLGKSKREPLISIRNFFFFFFMDLSENQIQTNAHDFKISKPSTKKTNRIKKFKKRNLIALISIKVSLIPITRLFYKIKRIY